MQTTWSCKSVARHHHKAMLRKKVALAFSSRSKRMSLVLTATLPTLTCDAVPPSAVTLSTVISCVRVWVVEKEEEEGSLSSALSPPGHYLYEAHAHACAKCADENSRRHVRADPWQEDGMAHAAPCDNVTPKAVRATKPCLPPGGKTAKSTDALPATTRPPGSTPTSLWKSCREPWRVLA